MEPTRALAGRTAAITGASSGIGRAIAERFGEMGANVVLAGRELSAMQQSAKQITEGGGTVEIVTGDIRDPACVESLVATATGISGLLDIFVNNAGVSFLGSVLDGTVDSWRVMLETNVLALLVGCQAAVRAMRAGGNPGHIVNVSSVAALSPTSGVYGATKHAVNVITATLREELLNDPIKITNVMPGLVATNLGRNVDPAILETLVAMSGIQAEVVAGARLPDDVITAAQAALSEIMIRPEDIANAVAFAVTQPPGVHLEALVVRPSKDFDL
jgi:NADP-dependent 3-hydroxy acid dehydrogenase YdfG